MADLVVVQVAEGVEGLTHDESRLILGQVLSFCDVVEQFTTFTEPGASKTAIKSRPDKKRYFSGN